MDKAEAEHRTKKCSIYRESGHTFKYCRARNKQHEGEVGSPDSTVGTSPDCPTRGEHRGGRHGGRGGGGHGDGLSF